MIANRAQKLVPEAVARDTVTAGALLLVANEMEFLPDAEIGLGSRTILDGWYNSQRAKIRDPSRDAVRSKSRALTAISGSAKIG